MLDMHTHILPSVDDGPSTIEESIELLKIAQSEGITHLISTSHAKSPQYNVEKNIVLEKLQEVRAAAAANGLTIELHAGQEIRIHEELVENLQQDKLLTLANSKYILLELPSSTVPNYTIPMIQNILSLNKIPIIAHPERNRAIAEKPQRLERLVTNGALAQVTAGSLSGHFGRGVQKLALQLVEANLIHTYGSDVHNATTRPALFEKGLEYLDRRGHHELADILIENNARILSNDELILLEPQPVERRKWWQLVGN